MIAASTSRHDGITAILAHPDFARLKRRIIDVTGLQYYDERDQVLADRIEQRCNQLNRPVAAYMADMLASAAGGEFSALVDDLTIGETYFFRYPEQFELLRQVVIPERLADQQGMRPLRIWSAGCASGAEPYSLAIVLADHFQPALANGRASILATDINRHALAQAHEGRFTDWELRTSGDDFKRRCFTRDGRHWVLRRHFRQSVSFEHQNLATDLAAFAQTNAGHFDIILCRNVMIYFSPALTRRLTRLFAQCLAPGGWLLVGHAEPYFEIANILSPVVAGGTMAYRKAGGMPDDAIALRPAEPQRRSPADDWVNPALHPEPELEIPVSTFVAPAVPAPSMTAPASTAPDAARSLDDDMARIRHLADAGNWSEAATAAEQGLKRHPLEPAAYYIYALIAEHGGSMAEAEDALGRAVYLDRSQAVVHYHLGRCQLRRGDRRAAQKSFDNAIRLLAPRPVDWTVPFGDGLTAGELRDLLQIHLEQMSR
ncbi:CheR family methyltransferase [Ferrovibrio xuzhouensis]|uniref:CheR family methyltransferase n=1 Tax=Ferrovibrio xuzhouensis TaxID=1576914 RepID=A0ABV7VFG3_9PROT